MAEDMLTVREIGMIFAGQKILAIKSVRERTGLGLRESKHLVDAAHNAVCSRPCPSCEGTGIVKLEASHLHQLLTGREC